MMTSNTSVGSIPKSAAGLQKFLLQFCGILFVGLAVLGALLPLLPTTPFLILASGCFMRSSPEMQKWLMRSPVWGAVLRDWEIHHAVKPRTKHAAFVVIATSLVVSSTMGRLSPILLFTMFMLSMIGLIAVWFLPVIEIDCQSVNTLRKPQRDAC